MRWRLIDSDLRPPPYTAAADEAILTARHHGLVPDTLHLYRRSVPAVSLGHFQRAEESVDLAVARENGVEVVRRLSGGSAIYTDPGQLVYSVVLRRSDLPASPQQTFEKVCGAIIGALSSLGLEASFEPPNDVLIDGRKVSGSAQARRWDVVVQHGTLLVDTDLGLMARVLRGAKRPAEGMTTLARELGRTPSMEEVKAAVVGGFARAFGVGIEKGGMTSQEEALTARLVEEKYGTAAHAFLR